MTTDNTETFMKLLKQLDTLMKQNNTITPEARQRGHGILNTSAVRVVKDNQQAELEARTVYQSMGLFQLAEKCVFSPEEKEVLEAINKLGHSGGTLGGMNMLGFYPRIRMY